MARLDVSPTYTHAARRDGVGRRDPGLFNAYFRMVDGELEIVTDLSQATHAFAMYNGRMIIEGYRADSTMVLGEGGETVGTIRVPDSELLFHYSSDGEWLEFPATEARASEALQFDSV